MPKDVYEKLREQLDQYSVGYPATASGVEMRILKKLFTREEAEMFLDLSLQLESPQGVAARTKRDPETTEALLAQMAEKGLIFRKLKDGRPLYGAVPFMVGIYEFQVDTMDRELAQLTEQYFEEAFEKRTSQQVVPLRTIPVNRAIQVSWPVAPYEDARKIIQSKKKIAVAKCICRVQQGLIDQACDKPLEVCLMFGSQAEHYVEKGMGRWITQAEALDILEKSEEAGLVTQPFNAQNPGGMCNCCGDCCGMLRSLKRHPRPAEMVISNYRAVVDPERCTACGTCTERCQMEAIAVESEDVAVVDPSRCIGCGLCVTTCPAEAVALQPKEQRRDPPPTARETMMELAEERGTSLIPLSFMNPSEPS